MCVYSWMNLLHTGLYESCSVTKNHDSFHQFNVRITFFF